MNIAIENKKAKAIELMKKLDIYKPYIKGFEKDNTVCFYENFGGFWAWQEPDLNFSHGYTSLSDYAITIHPVFADYQNIGVTKMYQFVTVKQLESDVNVTLM